ncbi:MAG: ABC transporter permease subunit, partial [Candidatus Omnitrophica bacterium]|nr:ABC transporter permease subunit [Candidatus Omnitrophota bacterium]
PRGPKGTGCGYLKGAPLLFAYIFIAALFLISILPHLGIILLSVSKEWFMSIIPGKMTLSYYQQVFSSPLTSSSIRNSLLYSIPAAGLDLLLGIGIAYFLARKVFRGKEILDLLSMLPLALPGIVLAFGYVVGFSGSILDVRHNPVPLIIISYSVRRLPYMVRSAYAGFQQLNPALEEASLNLGASPVRTAWKITIPLLKGNLIAGGILCFSFAMLEVSDSLILAMKEKFFPITKAIYLLLGRVTDGTYLASAMGVMGMALLFLGLVAAGRLLGRKTSDLFRA